MGAAGSPSASDAPYFRSYTPSSSPTRTFPILSAILDGSNTVLGENLPNSDATLNFRLTVRDNRAGGGGVDNDATSITVDDDAGPFEVTSQNSAVALTANGTNTVSITWDVANTDIGAVDCDFVDILFSTDNGATFPYTLASSTANDGSFTATVPSYPTFSGRIKIICSDNIFFDINDDLITISTACAANGTTFSPNSAVSTSPGDPSLDFSLSPTWGSVTTSISGSITSSRYKNELSL